MAKTSDFSINDIFVPVQVRATFTGMVYKLQQVANSTLPKSGHQVDEINKSK